MHRRDAAAPSSAPPLPPSSCPVRHDPSSAPAPHDSSASTFSKLNPRNWMPSNLSQAPHPSQTIRLPLDRERSSIPRGDADAHWEYPSPQQMYHALLRKGYDDTPADAVESMVAVHNFLNEGAWAEIVGWERRFAPGLAHGWRACRRGEAAFDAAAAAEGNLGLSPPRLARFQGRPKDMTPKAAVLQALGWAFPGTFGYVLTTEPNT